MRMPQDFVDAINVAIREVNPGARTMLSGSMTLGSEFNEWCGPRAALKYGLGPMPPADLAAFEAKFAEHRDALKTSLVANAVHIERERMKSLKS
jgi:hypothetical protein